MSDSEERSRSVYDVLALVGRLVKIISFPTLQLRGAKAPLRSLQSRAFRERGSSYSVAVSNFRNSSNNLFLRSSKCPLGRPSMPLCRLAIKSLRSS